MSTDNKKKRVKVFLTALIAVIVSLLIAVVILCFMFRTELVAIYIAYTTSEADTVQRQEENDKKTSDLLGQLTYTPMRDLTEEERKLLESGTLTQEEALALIRGEYTPTLDLPSSTEQTTADEGTKVTDASTAPIGTDESTADTAASQPQASTSASQTTAKEPAPAEAISDARVDDIIARIYLLRATYLNEIDKLIEQTKKEYIALPKNQHNLAGKMKVIERMVPSGNALEAKCDAEMEILLTELRGVLLEIGAETKIIGEIRRAYNEQKELKEVEIWQKYSPKLK